jgi:hypothetical protein
MLALLSQFHARQTQIYRRDQHAEALIPRSLLSETTASKEAKRANAARCLSLVIDPRVNVATSLIWEREKDYILWIVLKGAKYKYQEVDADLRNLRTWC